MGFLGELVYRALMSWLRVGGATVTTASFILFRFAEKKKKEKKKTVAERMEEKI